MNINLIGLPKLISTQQPEQFSLLPKTLQGFPISFKVKFKVLTIAYRFYSGLGHFSNRKLSHFPSSLMAFSKRRSTLSGLCLLSSSPREHKFLTFFRSLLQHHVFPDYPLCHSLHPLTPLYSSAYLLPSHLFCIHMVMAHLS